MGGIADGVTGIFSKPVQGAKKEGIGGFFKGVGQVHNHYSNVHMLWITWRTMIDHLLRWNLPI